MRRTTWIAASWPSNKAAAVTTRKCVPGARTRSPAWHRPRSKAHGRLQAEHRFDVVRDARAVADDAGRGRRAAAREEHPPLRQIAEAEVDGVVVLVNLRHAAECFRMCAERRTALGVRAREVLRPVIAIARLREVAGCQADVEAGIADDVAEVARSIAVD